MSTVDSHQHFWRLDRGDYGWLTPQLAPIYRDYLPEHLAPLLARAGVGPTIAGAGRADRRRNAIPARARAASTHSSRAWSAGWISKRRRAETIAKLADDPKLVGLRPMIQDIPDPGLDAATRLAPGLRGDARSRPGVRRAGAAASICPRCCELTARYPDLTMVLDHGAKPPIAAGDIERGNSEIAALARETPMRLQAVGTRHRSGQRRTPRCLRRRRSPARMFRRRSA